MIHEMTIRNYKCLRDVRVGLERFTIFVGPNASGKTSILQSIHVLDRFFNSQKSPSDDELLKERTRGTEEQVELAARIEGGKVRYRTAKPVSGRPDLTKPSESGYEQMEGGTENWSHWMKTRDKEMHVPESVFLRLESSNLRNPTTVSANPTSMTPTGAGMHSALASMTLNEPDSWQRLQADLRKIIPSIKRLRHTKPPNSSLLFDTVGGDSLTANQVSEGTLLVLGLLTALHGAERPEVILLDDIDRGLHPRAQKELITLLRGLLETNPKLQILATTHSPYLLNWMEPKEVRVTYLQDDGTTVCASLTDHPKFAKWKDEFSPGEMWSLFGEKWVTEKVVAS